MDTEKKDLGSSVAEWLEQQGYPLEMQVARAFQRTKLIVSQSEYYLDPETSVPREIDVIARTEGEWVDYFILDMVFAIECKKATKKPWVVFGTEPREKETKFLYQCWASSQSGHLFKRRLAESPRIRSLKLLQRPRNRGYGVTEALTTGKDIPYEAIMSVTKYASAFARKTNQMQQPDLKLKKEVVYCSLIFPIVILDGRLFEAHLDQLGKLQITEVEKSIILWKYPFSDTDQNQVVVRLSTLKDLRRLVTEVRKTVEVVTSS